jgi:hypothetical protein
MDPSESPMLLILREKIVIPVNGHPYHVLAEVTRLFDELGEFDVPGSVCCGARLNWRASVAVCQKNSVETYYPVKCLSVPGQANVSVRPCASLPSRSILIA